MTREDFHPIVHQRMGTRRHGLQPAASTPEDARLFPVPATMRSAMAPSARGLSNLAGVLPCDRGRHNGPGGLLPQDAGFLGRRAGRNRRQSSAPPLGGNRRSPLRLRRGPVSFECPDTPTAALLPRHGGARKPLSSTAPRTEMVDVPGSFLLPRHEAGTLLERIALLENERDAQARSRSPGDDGNWVAGCSPVATAGFAQGPAFSWMRRRNPARFRGLGG